jgi:ABC-type transport system involved in multi-copper enzyme maturation permease subunit
MSRRSLVFLRKTLRDCSRPKLLVAFLAPYLGVAVLLSAALTGSVREDIASAPLFTQEQVLVELFSQLSFVWLTAFPMVFVAVLVAVTVAGELEDGTFRLVLSKPLARWEPLLGKFAGVVLFGFLTTVAGLLVGAAALVAFAGVSPLAIPNGVGVLLPGSVVYALLVVTFVAAVGTAVAVATGDRLQTAIGTSLVPVLFFGFVFVRVVQPGDLYERLYLYVIDVNYHLGNVYVTVTGAFGATFNPSTQRSFTAVAGVYDTAGAWVDPLLGGIVGDVPLVGYVPPVASLALVGVLTVGLVAAALYRFGRMDVP